MNTMDRLMQYRILAVVISLSLIIGFASYQPINDPVITANEEVALSDHRKQQHAERMIKSITYIYITESDTCIGLMSFGNNGFAANFDCDKLNNVKVYGDKM